MRTISFFGCYRSWVQIRFLSKHAFFSFILVFQQWTTIIPTLNPSQIVFFHVSPDSFAHSIPFHLALCIIFYSVSSVACQNELKCQQIDANYGKSFNNKDIFLNITKR